VLEHVNSDNNLSVPRESEYIQDGYAREACSLDLTMSSQQRGETFTARARARARGTQTIIIAPIVHGTHFNQRHDGRVHGNHPGKQNSHERCTNFALNSRYSVRIDLDHSAMFAMTISYEFEEQPFQ
jgi:hypothetical protein